MTKPINLTHLFAAHLIVTAISSSPQGLTRAHEQLANHQQLRSNRILNDKKSISDDWPLGAKIAFVVIMAVLVCGIACSFCNRGNSPS